MREDNLNKISVKSETFLFTAINRAPKIIPFPYYIFVFVLDTSQVTFQIQPHLPFRFTVFSCTSAY